MTQQPIIKIYRMETALVPAAPAPAPLAVHACIACRQRKRKCSGEYPCAYCKKKGITCVIAEDKKRGPVPKKRKMLSHALNDIFTNQFATITNGIQEAMNKLHQQSTIVDFYFQFVGKIIPAECSIPLSTSPQCNLHFAQLCIITAHVMRFFRNSALENQFIQEANKNASSIFSCDSIESAVALMMMGCYAGKTPKGAFYATTAYNIAKLPSVNKGTVAAKIQKVARILSISLDDSLTVAQRSHNMIEPLDSLLAMSEITNIERMKILHTRLTTLVKLEMGTAFYDSSALSYFLGPRTISPAAKQEILYELQRLDEVQLSIPEGSANQVAAKFYVHFMKFLISWRSEEPSKTFELAIAAFEFYKSNSNLVSLWYQDDLLKLLLLPCYFSWCNAKELEQEMLSVLREAFAKIGNSETLQKLCTDLKLDLGDSKNYTASINDIEEVLLGDYSIVDFLSVNSNFDSFFHVL